jgi:hypothetical protein
VTSFCDFLRFPLRRTLHQRVVRLLYGFTFDDLKPTRQSSTEISITFADLNCANLDNDLFCFGLFDLLCTQSGDDEEEILENCVDGECVGVEDEDFVGFRCVENQLPVDEREKSCCGDAVAEFHLFVWETSSEEWSGEEDSNDFGDAFDG